MSDKAAQTSQLSAQELQSEFMAFLEESSDINVAKNCLKGLNLPDTGIYEGGLESAIKLLSGHRSPKILLIDISKTDLPVNELNRLAEVCEPGTKVITLGAKNDVGLYRDLMSLGISDYLVKPLLPELLSNAIKVLQGGDTPIVRTNRTGKVIAFLGARGGVGSTMIATTFSWILAQERSRRVAVIDLDLHTGSVSLYLDQQPNHGLREVLESPERMDEVFLDRLLTHISDRLKILSAEEPLDEIPDFTIEGLDTLVNFLVKQFHYVIIDIPRRFNAITQSIIEHTNIMVVTAEPSLASARDTERISRLFSPFGANRRLVIVLNKMGEYKTGEVKLEEFEGAIGNKVDIVIPYDSNDIADLLNRGQPLTNSRNSRVPPAIRRLVDQLGGGAVVTEEKEGIFDKLFGMLK
ncbi:AAA family ATPase [Candidatus Bealeia paramacronuclearis]|uniref:AAA family ATPase n=1 Tax=Candidatus Bealeia paramacronuclearis TaxID=1921001 RepID=A0ABZ2C347_9PROT|nr:AAA family ATPase [Candidatus Bealeia paramacronuclearis]